MALSSSHTSWNLAGNSNYKFRFDESLFEIKEQHAACIEGEEGNPVQLLKPDLNL